MEGRQVVRGVLIQDTLELVEQAPANDVYALLLADARFMCAPT